MENVTFLPVGEFLKKKLQTLDLKSRVSSYGVVESCNADVIRVSGLRDIRYGEILEIEGGAYALALDLELDGCGAVLLNQAEKVEAGSVVQGTGEVASICTGEALLGRVIDPLGRPLDAMPLTVSGYRPCEMPAPAIMDRAPVNQSLETGILAIDSMIPIGRGQRELIIGDRQTGKTSIALSTILHQKKNGSGVICIYCAIGQKNAALASVRETLASEGALDNCVLVAAGAAETAALQYLAPYAAASIAESFMLQGKDVLVVYDDLSKHAVAYRSISLLLRRPAGREAYPGDIFYLHARLLERAAHLSPEKGGGSVTALPIIETLAGDISSYIPTNVISITDGQIYLESGLFNAGIRPAINVGLSVSRVGRNAQTKAMKKFSGLLRLEIAQYRDLAAFTQFGAEIDAATAKVLNRGAALTELFKQPLREDLLLSQMCALLLAANEGYFDDAGEIFSEKRRLFLEALKTDAASAMKELDQSGEWSAETEKLLREILARLGAENHAERA